MIIETHRLLQREMFEDDIYIVTKVYAIIIIAQAVDTLTAELRSDGFEVVSGPRTTGDGYYESCIIGIEGNQIEITV